MNTREHRKRIKAERAALDAKTISAHSRVIANQLWQCKALWRAKRIGVYLAAFGEVDCSDFITQAGQRKKRIFAPILRKKGLYFAPLKPRAGFTKNRYGIREPRHSARKRLYPQQLDVVLVPLVAFDTQLNRIGMGGGYYDRSFALRKRRKNWRKPLLIGLAYSFQHIDTFSANTWDVPLDVVITEKECLGSY